VQSPSQRASDQIHSGSIRTPCRAAGFELSGHQNAESSFRVVPAAAEENPARSPVTPKVEQSQAKGTHHTLCGGGSWTFRIYGQTGFLLVPRSRLRNRRVLHPRYELMQKKPTLVPPAARLASHTAFLMTGSELHPEVSWSLF